MKAALGNYERLGQFFKSKAELAAAGCMTRPTLAQALSGPRGFTNNEKQAIKNALVVKVIQGTAKQITVEELLSGDFDELFRIKE